MIYLLHSDSSNQTYVGKSINETKRMQGHEKSCLKENSQNVHKHIMETGGWENWNRTILERMESSDRLQEREQHFIDVLKPSLNMRNAKKKDKKKELI